ncbi:MAG: preprotein translocase subunit SecG [Flavobacteriales bacterium]
MLTAISILILVICALLARVVLAQNPKGGGLAAGFTGAQQIGGVQKTADFLEKGTWTLAASLMVLCLVSAGLQGGDATVVDDMEAIDTTEQAAPGEEAAPAEGAQQAPAEGQEGI